MSKGKNSFSDNTEIEKLNFSTRIYNCLCNSGIRTIKDLCSWSNQPEHPKSLLNIRYLGRGSVREITQKIHSLGFKFSNEDTIEPEKIIDLQSACDTLETRNKETGRRIDSKRKLLERYGELLKKEEDLRKEEESLNINIAKCEADLLLASQKEGSVNHESQK